MMREGVARNGLETMSSAIRFRASARKWWQTIILGQPDAGRAWDLGILLGEGHEKEPESMSWVSQYTNANEIKTDFFEARSTAYAKSTILGGRLVMKPHLRPTAPGF